MSGGVLVFRYASHSGVSSGWSSMDTGSSRGAAAAGGDNRDDGVASIGDRTGVTGALYFGANVSRKSCSQPGSAVTSGVTIPAVTPTFSSTSCPAASPEVPRDASSGHVPLGSHVIHPRAPSSRPMPRDPVSRPRWVRLRESPPSTPDAPDEPESSTDPRIDSAAMTEDLSILQGLLSGLPMSLWSTVMDIDGH